MRTAQPQDFSAGSNERACAFQLLSAARPVCIAGRGATWAAAAPALLRLCRLLPALRVCTTPGAKGIISERHPQALGVCGFSGHRAAREAVSAADVLLVLGTRLFEQAVVGCAERIEQTGVVFVDRDPVRAVPRRDGQLAISGDISAVLQRVCDEVERAIESGICAQPPADQSLVSPTRASAISRFSAASEIDQHLKPQAVFGILNEVAAEVPIAVDAGNSMCWAIEWLERTVARQFQVSVDWGTMGFALPAAIGTSLACGRRPCIAVTGDGSMAMAGGDLHTAVECDLPVVVVVLNDAGAGMVKAGCEAWFGPKAIPDPDYRNKLNMCLYARALGAYGAVISSGATLISELRAALSRCGPSLLDVQIDPSEVPTAITERVRGIAGQGSSHANKRFGGMC